MKLLMSFSLQKNIDITRFFIITKTHTSTKKQIWVEKAPSGSPGHMRQNACSHNLKWTFEDLIAVLLLCNKDQEYNNPLTISQPASAGKGANCALALTVSGALRSRLCSDGPCVHLSGPAYMPSCIRPEVRLPLDQRILCRPSDCKNVGYYV